MEYQLAKYVQGEPLDLRRVDKSQGAYITELRNAGFLDFVPSEQPTGEPERPWLNRLMWWMESWCNRGVLLKMRHKTPPCRAKLCLTYPQRVSL